MHTPHHHQHVRSRMYRNLEPFPHPVAWKRILDTVIYAVGFLGPAFTVPQIYMIYAAKSAAGISLVTWVSYAAFNIVWILYGLAHRERVIVFTYTLWFIVNLAVALGAAWYG